MALPIVKRWGGEGGLLGNPSKTVIIPFISKRKLEITMPVLCGNRIQIGMEVTAAKCLSRVQRLAYLGTIGAIKGRPTAAMKVVLNLPPLDINFVEEDMMADYRLHNICHSEIVNFRDDVTQNVKDLRTGKNNFRLKRTGALVCCSSSSLEKLATFFQIEATALTKCMRIIVENAIMAKPSSLTWTGSAALQTFSNHDTSYRALCEMHSELRHTDSHSTFISLLSAVFSTGLSPGTTGFICRVESGSTIRIHIACFSTTLINLATSSFTNLPQKSFDSTDQIVVH
ncbi:hypothetical protein J6590_069443 [Homalodisca vitripennis]|nr:hypothetical protein J6590_069443 [Homalodisca vitripennis]